MSNEINSLSAPSSPEGSLPFGIPDLPSYRHTPDMGEISGFGGGYENECQALFEAGVLWLRAHPNAELRFSEWRGVFGFLEAKNSDANELEAVLERVSIDSTGAMFHAVLMRLVAITEIGWEAFVKKLREEQAKRLASGQGVF